MERTIALAPAAWSALDAIARAEGTTVSDLVRGCVHRDLSRRRRAKTAGLPDERLIARLRALLADDFAYASGWGDLNRRLRAKGYVMIEAGEGVALAEAATGQRLCKGADLGYSHARLARRFHAPFPGHIRAGVFGS
ncbi:ribbon-helix-helix domain-containing protein [Defluviimonas sp. WL0075]|uniref:Ribbon-helix-helix domain-containing protein n=1 Tax=Albidovulum sediminicola TaxID=2984331 RepID=A0ABT2Z5A7_9RHOB|nr:ribbon-helix-helix domain-containing protein [Defluviimonas sp. WL0075]MCV2866282.1 ribbon-helix-helix domain-containing protein [Defluviimonas sp. WL0075]